jgi:hypothetical protein
MNDPNNATSSVIKISGGTTKVERTLISTMRAIHSEVKTLAAKQRKKPGDLAAMVKLSDALSRLASQFSRLRKQIKARNVADDLKPPKPRVPSFPPGVPIHIPPDPKSGV